ncbi:MAG: glycosyltransferase [Candidatus Niameybacter stercoravium]|nr:glycosyltransferase [Candidatus Niameybacter stercoravium]
MIVRNEEKMLGRCLSSVKDCVDEIIIVDTGSLDHTVQIAKKFGAKVFSFKWIDDFSAARNFSFSKATQDYSMWLDADDILLEEDREKLIWLKQHLNPDIDVIMMPYQIDMYNGKTMVTCFRERLLKTSRNFKWIEPVHEAILPKGNIYYADVVVRHAKVHNILTQRNLEIYEKHLAKGNSLSPRGKLYYGKELYEHGRYEEAKKWLITFLKEKQVEPTEPILACRILSKCYKQLDEKENSLSILYKSFQYDAPQRVVCCDIGDFYSEEGAYEKATFWYELACRLPEASQVMGRLWESKKNEVKYEW